MAEIELATRSQLEDYVPVTRRQLPDGTDLNDCRTHEYAGTWQISSVNDHANRPSVPSAAVAFTVEIGNTNNAVVQRWVEVSSGVPIEYVRKLINPTGDGGGPLYSGWARTTAASSSGASLAILDLARSDGWAEVYDPSNSETVLLDDDGNVVRINAGLDNLTNLVSASGREPKLMPNEFGQMHGMDFNGGHFLRTTFGSLIPTPLTIMVVGKWEGGPTSSGFEVLVDGNGGTRKNITVRSSRPGMPFGDAASNGDEYFADREPHVFTLQADENRDVLRVDGQYASHRSNPTEGLSGLILGSVPGIGSFWRGKIGAVLVYRGKAPAEVIDRMHNLLYSLMGKCKGATILRPTTTAMAVTESGRTLLTHGDVDMVWPTGIQSITKLQTILTARTVLSESDFHSMTEPYEEGDDGGGSVFAPGDTATLYDWAWASVGPSFNASNEVIARAAGRLMPGDGDPKEKFRKEMNRLGAEWFGNEVFTNFSYAATLSARQTIDLLRRSFDDAVLASLLGLRNKSVSFTGPNPRSYTWGHTIPTNAGFDFPEWEGGKTGGGQGDGFVVTKIWSDYCQESVYIAIMNTPTVESDHRYIEMLKVMMAIETGGHNVGLNPSTQPKRGDGLAQTGMLDVTELFGAYPAGGSASQVLLERQGDWVRLAFQGVTLPADFTASNIIPVQFRPKTFEYATLMGDALTPRELRINSAGTVNVYGNAADEVLRGSIMWRTRREWPLEMPS